MSLKFLEFCDHILVLEDGKVLEDGDHDGLVKAGGRYAQLISSYPMKEPQVSKATFQHCVAHLRCFCG